MVLPALALILLAVAVVAVVVLAMTDPFELLALCATVAIIYSQVYK